MKKNAKKLTDFEALKSHIELNHSADTKLIDLFNDTLKSAQVNSIVQAWKVIEPIKFFRKCDKTGEGMNEGFCFGDGEKYFKYKKDATEYAKKIGYKSLKKAFDDEAYYYTEWSEE